jgi:hypothetical protein
MMEAAKRLAITTGGMAPPSSSNIDAGPSDARGIVVNYRTERRTRRGAAGTFRR